MSGSYTLQILHAADFEAATAALDRAPNFAAIVDALEDTYDNSITLSSGDNYLPGSLHCRADGRQRHPRAAHLLRRAARRAGGEPRGPHTAPARFDIAILNAIGVQASVFGNHEFDLGPEVVAGAIDVTAAAGA
jgi:2',3'-cyclic-nucleotide 2'-phosphodiesterase (5'-nucleotidase family)